MSMHLYHKMQWQEIDWCVRETNRRVNIFNLLVANPGSMCKSKYNF